MTNKELLDLYAETRQWVSIEESNTLRDEVLKRMEARSIKCSCTDQEIVLGGIPFCANCGKNI